jgi:flagellar biosynthesis/type III secretory pathway chaperone
MEAIDRLLPLLGNQREVLLRLLELVHEERTYLLNSQLDHLETAVEAQGNLLAKEAALSTQITRVLDRLGKELHISGRASLARIIEHLTGSVADELRDYYRSLTQLADQLQREGRINWHLAQQALKYVDFTLKLIGDAKHQPVSYGPSAHRARGKSTQLLMDSCV